MEQNLKGKRIAVYARFSSDKQNATSADDQVARCCGFVADRGGVVSPERCFKDAAVSGASLQRPDVERMLALVRSKALDVVVVEDLDRLSRDLGDSHRLLKEMRFYDVEMISASDGMSSLSPSAKTHLLLKGFMSEAYLDNLADKTLRGQLARFTAGYATGAVAYGFRTTPKVNAVGEVVAHEISVDPEAAEVVRRVFRDYLAGRSLALIASGLNAAKVPPPRSKKRTGTAAWGDSTIRAMLHNRVYSGVWEFARRKWTKVPGTNVRRPKARSPADAPLAQERPNLRVIDPATWEAVHERLAAIHRHYAGQGATNTIRGKPNAYLLSGLLVCDRCGSLMYVYGGGKYRRYRCTGFAKRGVCSNSTTVLETVARTGILTGVSRVLTNDFALAYAQKVAQQRATAAVRSSIGVVKAKRAELVKTEARIRTLVERMGEGAGADYVRQHVDELAIGAKALKAELAALEATPAVPVERPTQEVVRGWLLDLDVAVKEDPLAARENLRGLLKGGQVRLEAQPDGVFLAKTEVLPLVLLKQRPPLVSPEGAVLSSQHCGGRI